MKKTLPLLLIISFLVTFTGCKKNSPSIDISQLEESTLETKYLDKPSTGRPKNHKEIDNIFIALNTLKNASYYESSSSGEVVAKKAIKLATQTVTNRRIITPNATFSESISVSSFVKVAEQLYSTDSKTLKRDAKKVSSSANITWNNNVTELTEAKQKELYGYSHNDPTRYIINEKTIISEIEVINNGIGRKYSYKFYLDPQIASYYYRNSVKTLSGSSSHPTFKSIEVTMTFDYKWRMSKIETNEVYEIDIPALGAVTCYAHLTETFKNFEKRIEISEQSFFKNYL